MNRASLAIVAILLTACGGGTPTATATATVSASALATAASASECSDKLLAALDAFEELDSRLDVGMTLDNYTERVGDAKVALDAVGESDDKRCEKAVDRLSQALEAYEDAADIWADCPTSSTCTQRTLEPELRAKWSSAENRLKLARKALGDQ